MKTIRKFPFAAENTQIILMPKGAKILAVQTQNGRPFLWAMCDTERETEVRQLWIYGTGQPLNFTNDSGIDYVGTFQLSGGSLVYHAFTPKQ